MRGTTPEPPATSSTGPGCPVRQTNQPPTGPRTRTASPTARPSARKVETSPSGTRWTVSSLGRRDGVAPGRRVAVGRGEPHVDVLTRQVTGPPVDVEDERHGAVGLGASFDERGLPPRAPGAQSPWYRCSRHGSP